MCNTNRSLGNSAENTAISFQRYLTFITECSVTTIHALSATDVTVFRPAVLLVSVQYVYSGRYNDVTPTAVITL